MSPAHSDATPKSVAVGSSQFQYACEHASESDPLQVDSQQSPPSQLQLAVFKSADNNPTH